MPTPNRFPRLPTALLACLCATILPLRPAHAQNPGVVTVPNPESYREVVAISDVHGEYAHVQTLLRSAGVIDAGDHWAAGKTLMVVVGDSIDKGPQSIEVLRLWMRLQKEASAKGGQLIVLLGNHEAEFLADPTGDKKAKPTLADAATDGIVAADVSDPGKPIGQFLRGLPVAARIGNWVFCHAAWIPDEPWAAFVAQAKSTLDAGKYGEPLLAADDSILEKKAGANGKKWWHSKSEVRELERRLDVDGLAGVVFGHQPSGLGITDNVGETADGRIFKIDSGMAPPTSDDGSGDAGSGATGPPYAGHLLIFTAPAELAQPRSAGHSIDAVSVDSTGHRATVMVAP